MNFLSSHGGSGLGFGLLMTGRLDEALTILRQAYMEAPTFASTRLGLTRGYAAMERWDEARATAAQLLSHAPSMSISRYQGHPPI